MIKSYLLHNEDGTIKQFTRCDETEIELYQSEYIEYSEDSFEFDSNYTYKIENNEIVKTERNDNSYLLSKANADFEAAISSLTSSTPTSEISTWTKQEQEARAYLLDDTAATPFIDAACLAREVDKSYLVGKIIEKADAYATAVGTLTGIRQKQEKLIIEGE
jgi:hypothetical protein